MVFFKGGTVVSPVPRRGVRTTGPAKSGNSPFLFVYTRTSLAFLDGKQETHCL